MRNKTFWNVVFSRTQCVTADIIRGTFFSRVAYYSDCIVHLPACVRAANLHIKTIESKTRRAKSFVGQKRKKKKKGRKKEKKKNFIQLSKSALQLLQYLYTPLYTLELAHTRTRTHALFVSSFVFHAI